MLYLENFIGNRITNLNGAKPGKWRAMIRTERRIWASDSASLHLRVASQMAMTSVQDNDTPALNALKALRGAPISMGRGETPVGCCQWPSGYSIFHITHAEAHIILSYKNKESEKS